MSRMFVTGLTCFSCGACYSADQLINLCTCGKPLRVDYDLKLVGRHLAETLRPVEGTGVDLWRWRAILPLPEGVDVPSLGEGGTPLVPAPRLAAELGVRELFVKDEAVNPTGSFKARGMAVAVAMAKHLGATNLAVPSAGNAGGALAAYAALHGLEAHVFMPRDVPEANRLECEIFGAHVTLVDGLINDCAKLVADLVGQGSSPHPPTPSPDGRGGVWFDMSTLKEPYRVEGKKTMAYEVAEQLGWAMPSAIIYPTGGGTGLIGMGKAFDEMEAMGWIGADRPRMYSVQAEGCAPIARAYESGAREAPLFENASTIASGLRVPKAIGDFIMLDLIRATGGKALTVADGELIADALVLGATTGVCACPEGGACLAALRRLVAQGEIGAEDSVVLFNTGSGVKYADAFASTPSR